ncbi:MAG: M36 family metallopeptidase [Hymenobacter sp.]
MGADWDGSFDNGVVSHEYGHGTSNRLTGGPATASCAIQTVTTGSGSTAVTTTTQGMGEGWSDFFGSLADHPARRRWPPAALRGQLPGQWHPGGGAGHSLLPLLY